MTPHGVARKQATVEIACFGTVKGGAPPTSHLRDRAELQNRLLSRTIIHTKLRQRQAEGCVEPAKTKGSLLVLVTLPFALACVVSAFTLAVITHAVIAFAFVPFLAAIVVFVFLVVVLRAMGPVISSSQNFTCLNIRQSAHR